MGQLVVGECTLEWVRVLWDGGKINTTVRRWVLSVWIPLTEDARIFFFEKDTCDTKRSFEEYAVIQRTNIPLHYLKPGGSKDACLDHSPQPTGYPPPPHAHIRAHTPGAFPTSLLRAVAVSFLVHLFCFFAVPNVCVCVSVCVRWGRPSAVLMPSGSFRRSPRRKTNEDNCKCPQIEFICRKK